MTEMTPERWRFTSAYVREVFGRQDAHLAGLMAEAVAAALPDIAVSAEVGRLLEILTATTRGRLAIEAGTLGGYSAIWIARGLSPSGRLITIEREPAHAAFARAQLERAGVADRVEVRVGLAIAELKRLGRELDPESVDVVFLDAVKQEYQEYFQLTRPLLARGGLLLADNVLGSGSWWIDDLDHADRRAVDRFNRALAADPAFDAVILPLGNGVLLARKRRPT